MKRTQALSALSLLALLGLLFRSPLCAQEVPVPPDGAAAEEDYEPPAAGYEERYYPMFDLLAPLMNFPDPTQPAQVEPSLVAPDHDLRLSEDDILQIIKTCAGPETWQKRGPARLRVTGQSLVVLQKKEVHDEIAQVLKWIREGVRAPVRGTILVVALKPELLTKLVQNPMALTGAELTKVLEDAGQAGAAQIIEVRGIEGQTVAVSGTQRQSFIRDYDVSGAVYDPVVDTLVSGLRVSALCLRSPDCKSIYVELKAALDRDVIFEKAKIVNSLAAQITSAPRPTAAEGQAPPPAPPGQFKPVGAAEPRDLIFNLPVRTSATLNGTVTMPRGKFVLAGTLDLSLVSKDAQPDRLAFFVRTSIGGEGVPTLSGVSGLKPGELFRLYPARTLTRPIVDLPGPAASLTGMSAYFAGAEANAFSAPPPSSPALRRARSLFQENVRKDKLVEPLGPVVFARLPDADHHKLAEALQADYTRRGMPLQLHAVALALPADTARRLLLAEADTFEAAAVAELARSNNAQVLVDQAFNLLPRQRSFVVSGRKKAYVADYDISGDAYDPVIRELLGPGFILDVRPVRTGDAKIVGAEVRVQIAPGTPAPLERISLGSYSLLNGASEALTVSVQADLDLPKCQFVDIRQNVELTLGRYVLAGSAADPSGDDPKAARQVLLFVRADELAR